MIEDINIVNTLRPRQNESHFADDIFKCIFFNENVWILIKVSLKFVPKGPINNIPSLVQIMAWRRTGDKPLSEPMVTRSATHICVTRTQWVNPSAAEAGRFYNNSMFGTCSTPWPAQISIQEQCWMQFLESKWWQNDPKGQCHWPPFSTPAERIPRCICGANLMILDQIHCNSSCRQAKFPRI